MKPIIPVIAGPTAVGKTAVSVELAGRMDAEIVSADSRQIYAPFRIGTARATPEDMQGVRHHLVGEWPLDSPYSAGRFSGQAKEIIPSIQTRNKQVIVVGGSTLYVHALIHGLSEIPPVDPQIRENLNQELITRGAQDLHAELVEADPAFATTLDPTKSQRIVRGLEVYRGTGTPLSHFHTPPPLPDQRYQLVVLHVDRELLYARIDQRVEEMLAEGLLDEVKQALADFPDRSLNAWRTIGYQELIPFFEGVYDLEEAVRLIKRNSRRYAKRQLTWYQRYKDALWLDMQKESSVSAAERIQDEVARQNH